MAETNMSKLEPENHLLLDQSLLRLPLEIQRRNFKKSQTVIDHEQKTTTALLKEAAQKASNQDPTNTLNALDAMIGRMEKLKRRLEVLNMEEQALHEQSAKRINHLQELYEIPSLVDVKYDEWSRTRLDRLVVDYLLRQGYSQTAALLAQAKSITDLIDLDTFVNCHKIADSIQRGSTTEALQWIRENRDALKKLLEKQVAPIPNTDSSPAVQPKITTLEFELRFQEYIELLRAIPRQDSARYDALIHAQKYFTPHNATHATQARTAAGLLAQNPLAPTEPYVEYFSPARWTYLSQLFIETHHQLLNLPTRPLLHVALSAGLSALKTPACHSTFNPASATTNARPQIATTTTTTATLPDSSTTRGTPFGVNTSLCPICSIELNALATNVPYAHHTKSLVEPDAVVLPNGRVYGRARLEELQRKQLRATGVLGGAGRGEDMIGRADTKVIDPVTGEEFLWGKVERVFIT